MTPQQLHKRLFQAFEMAPLPADDPRWVDCAEARGGDPSAEMETAIRYAAGPTCQFLAGHRGAGKTTELNRLASRLTDPALGDKFLVIRCDAAEYMEPSLTDVSNRDVLLAVGVALLRIGPPVGRALARIKPPAGTRFERFRRELAQLPGAPVARRVGVAASLELDLLSAIRDEIKALDAAGRRKGATGGVVLLVDDLDKIACDRVGRDTDRAYSEDWARSLASLGCHVVWTLPPDRCVPQDHPLAGKGEIRMLPTLSVTARNRRPYPPGVEALTEIVRRRIRWADPGGDDHFAPDDIFALGVPDALCVQSGGSLAQLCQLVRQSLLAASQFPVRPESLTRALHHMRDPYLRTLGPEHRAALAGGAGDLSGAVWAYPELLRTGTVLEYQDTAGPWWEINPLLRDLLPGPQRAERPTATVVRDPWTLSMLSLRNVGCFCSLDWAPALPERDGQWLFLVGVNGLGKSTLLRALCLALSPPQVAQSLLTTYTSGCPLSRFGAASALIEVNRSEVVPALQLRPVPGEADRMFARGDWESPFLVAYGARRGSALGGAAREVDLEAPLPGVATLFDEGASLVHAETWLKEQQLAALQGNEADRRFLADLLATLCALLPGVTELRIAAGGVRAIGPVVGDVPIAALSDGYLTTLGWVIDLVARWLHQARRQGVPVQAGFNREMAGVVLVDELDLHLHPQWQLDLVRTLREAFPRLTFIVTTHNPLTLLGARPGEIHILWRSGDGEQPRLLQQDIPPATNVESVLTGAWFGLVSTLDHDTVRLLDQHQRYLVEHPGSTEPSPVLDELTGRLRGPLVGLSLERLLEPIGTVRVDGYVSELSPDQRERARELLAQRRKGGAPS